MRPVLAPSRHNKIPLSVRQVCMQSFAVSTFHNQAGYLSYNKWIKFLLEILVKLLFGLKIFGNENESHPSAVLLDFGLKPRKAKKDVDNLTRKWRKNCMPNPYYVFLWEMLFITPITEEIRTRYQMLLLLTPLPYHYAVPSIISTPTAAATTSTTTSSAATLPTPTQPPHIPSSTVCQSSPPTCTTTATVLTPT